MKLAIVVAVITINKIASKYLLVELEGDNDICALPKHIGTCKAAFRRFYYDNHSGQCKKFIWGGCSGNGNRFDTMEECEGRCKAPQLGEQCGGPDDDQRYVYDECPPGLMCTMGKGGIYRCGTVEYLY